MAEKYFCDGDCGADLTYGPEVEIMVRRKRGDWRRHKLCKACAEKNIFLIDKNGQYVSTSGFASDVLR